ncbi:hypothetical protein [Streptomyces niveus]|uniref:hypothetical protein n=1 Tax=Streptomyces niveus TaxID=193462 RepID=UPI001495E2CB|nr:hypothetical protein [Streptomyces niveus]
MCRKDQAVRLAEFAKMPEEQRRVRLADLAASVNRRLAAVDGAEPDETKEETPPPAPDLPVNASESEPDTLPASAGPRPACRSRRPDLERPHRRGRS